MFDHSITGIRTNLEAFDQAAARIANPNATLAPSQTPERQMSRNTTQVTTQAGDGRRATAQRTEQMDGAQSAYRKAPAQTYASSEKTGSTARAAETSGADSSKEAANEPRASDRETDAVDLANEKADMMVAQRGAEANMAALKAAMALSGQTVDILA